MPPADSDIPEELQLLHDQCLALLDSLAEQSQGTLAPGRWRNILTSLRADLDLKGMRRAARELRDAIAVLAPADRFALLRATRDRTGGSLRRLDKADRRVAAKIFARRKIRNDNEYYILHIYLDSLEEIPDKTGKAAKVRALLLGYHPRESPDR